MRKSNVGKAYVVTIVIDQGSAIFHVNYVQYIQNLCSVTCGGIQVPSDSSSHVLSTSLSGNSPPQCLYVKACPF